LTVAAAAADVAMVTMTLSSQTCAVWPMTYGCVVTARRASHDTGSATGESTAPTHQTVMTISAVRLFVCRFVCLSVCLSVCRLFAPCLSCSLFTALNFEYFLI